MQFSKTTVGVVVLTLAMGVFFGWLLFDQRQFSAFRINRETSDAVVPSIRRVKKFTGRR